jgi:hypothetical protein
MHDLRKSIRYGTIGKAQITDAPKCKFIVKNLSITGCCLECITTSNKLKTSEKYKVNIEPERKAHIHKFELEVECIWVRNGEDYNEFGFEIYSFPKGKNFQNYVDYLAYRTGLV